MMKSYKTIRVEKREGIGYLSLNRPDVRNAFNQEMIDEIRDALSLINKDEEIRVLIITGEGKAFQAGADITELNLMKPMDLLRWNEGIVRINGALEKLRQPVIAAINGAAMGPGQAGLSACLDSLVKDAPQSCCSQENPLMRRKPIGLAWSIRWFPMVRPSAGLRNWRRRSW
jgi:enoyl-CoA hydratase/carnithine racemase